MLDVNTDYIFLLDGFELAMSVNQIDRVIDKHNRGIDYRLISKQERRHPVEILVAIIHQAVTGKNSSNRGNVDIKRALARLI